MLIHKKRLPEGGEIRVTAFNIIIGMFLLLSFTVDSRRNNGYWYLFLKHGCDRRCHNK
jgi:hypothetical protein